MSHPSIRRAARLRGRTLVLRDAGVDDAAFILALRTDAEKSRYLSRVTGEVQSQIDWLRAYRQGGGQAYFIIEDEAGQALGTVRLYDEQGCSFCWGSWILSAQAPSHAAIESALMVYAYAIDVLGFSSAHFQVSQGNERVWRFHERFGAVRVGADTEQDDGQFHYVISAAAIQASRQRYQRYLPHGVTEEATA